MGSFSILPRLLKTARTDTDCVPSPGWIGQGVAVLQWAALVAGRIEFTFQPPPNPVEYADSVFHLQQWTYVQQGYAATGNAFTWRWVFDEVGLFDERLHHLGDRQWGQRVCAAGYAIAYASHAWVAHPARSTLSALMGKVRRQARAMDSLKPYTVSTLIQQLLPFGHRFYQFVLGDGQPWSLKLSFVAIAHLIKYVVAWEMVLALGSRRAPDSSEPSPHGSSRGLPGRDNLGSLPQPHDAP